MNSLRLQSDTSDLRTRFARGVGRPIRQRVADLFGRAVSWLTPLSVEDPCLKGHKYDLKNWCGPTNYCQDCGELLMSTSQLRRVPEQTTAVRVRLNQTSNRVLH